MNIQLKQIFVKNVRVVKNSIIAIEKGATGCVFECKTTSDVLK